VDKRHEIRDLQRNDLHRLREFQADDLRQFLERASLLVTESMDEEERRERVKELTCAGLYQGKKSYT
jgi:hypothetical protein